MHHDTSPAAAPAIVDRVDGDAGCLARVTPPLALALLLAFVLQSCLTQPPAAPAVPRFDPAAAERHANTAALAALAALRPDAPAEQVIGALNLAAINFATGSSDLPATAQPLLAAAARALTALPPTTRIVVHGHTDNRGAVEANLALSNQRADAVRAALVARGVPAERLATQAHGDARPVASNATDEGRFRNRRIEYSLAP
jgi:outer membrane protein OmpA-like peptidoglycan-associated protein